MTKQPDDDTIRAAIAEAHRDDGAGAPPFAASWRAARGRIAARRSHRPAIWLGAGFGLATVAAALLLWMRPPAPRDQVAAAPDATIAAAPSAVDLSAGSWRTPLDFLLDTPGRDVLRTVPALRSSLPASTIDPSTLTKGM